MHAFIRQALQDFAAIAFEDSNRHFSLSPFCSFSPLPAVSCRPRDALLVMFSKTSPSFVVTGQALPHRVERRGGFW
jgi:hypothetical protein